MAPSKTKNPHFTSSRGERSRTGGKRPGLTMTATLFALAEDINPRLFDELNAATEHGSTFEDPDGFRVVLVSERWEG